MSMLQLIPGLMYNRKLGLQEMQLRQTLTLQPAQVSCREHALEPAAVSAGCRV